MKKITTNSSQLPRVLLQVNPGLDRQLNEKLSLMDRLRDKSEISIDTKRKRIQTRFEQRRQRKTANAAKTYKIDDDTKQVDIDLINVL